MPPTFKPGRHLRPAVAKVKERSAGAVLYRAAAEGRRYLLLQYGAGHWGFPKGHVEAGETEEQAAIREVEEETGIPRAHLKFIPGFRGRTDYRFRRGRTTVEKGVEFFLVEAAVDKVVISHEHTGFVWLPYGEALQRLSFDGPKRLLIDAESFLSTLPVA